MKLTCMRRFRNRKTGLVSTHLLDVLPKRATVNRSYVIPLMEPVPPQSMFVEVEVVPSMELAHPSFKKLMKQPAGALVLGKEQHLKALARALRKTVARDWDPSRFHLILHSSGYDSRILSATIRQLYNERGADWLGEVLFACHGSESGEFKAIMHYEGWNESQYIASADYEAIYAQCLDFANAWQWLNGCYYSPYNLSYVFVEQLQQAGVVPSSGVQLWSGYSTDYLLKYAGAASNQLQKGYVNGYRAATSLALHPQDAQFPYADFEVLSVAATSSARLGYDVRPILLKYLDPGLAKFRRVAWKRPPVSQLLFDKAYISYIASWYKRNVAPEALQLASPQEGARAWWSRWTSAAFCEYLIKSGHELGVI